MSDSLQPHELQHARLPCRSSSPRVCPSSCPLHRWCHLAISSSDASFSFCPQSFPASGTFPISQLFISGDQNTGASALTSILPTSIQSWFPLRLTGLISFLSKGLSGVFSSSTVWMHQFFGALTSLWSSSHNPMWPLGRPKPWLYGPLLAEWCHCFSTQSRFVPFSAVIYSTWAPSTTSKSMPIMLVSDPHLVPNQWVFNSAAHNAWKDFHIAVIRAKPAIFLTKKKLFWGLQFTHSW